MTNGHNKSVLFILLLLLQLLMPLRYTRLLPLQNINIIHTHTYFIRYYSIIAAVLATLIGYQKKTDGTRLTNCFAPSSLSTQYILYTCMVRMIRHGNVWCDNDHGPYIWNGNRRTRTWALLGEKINSTNFRNINLTRPVF